MVRAKEFQDKLTLHEKTEILDFDHVYYMASKENKYHPSKLERLVNNGFDDEEGYYRMVKGD